MLNNPDFEKMSEFERFEYAVKSVFMNISQAAKKMGLARQTLYSYKYTGNFGSEMLKKIETILEIRQEFIRHGDQPIFISGPMIEVKHNTNVIKVYDIPVHANIGSLASFEDLKHSYIELPLEIRGFAIENLIGFKVIGDSMSNIYMLPGSVIVVDKTKIDPNVLYNGQLVVLNLNGTLIVKFWVKTEEGIRLRSANPACDDIVEELDDKLKLIGIVVAFYWTLI